METTREERNMALDADLERFEKNSPLTAMVRLVAAAGG